MIVRRPCYRLTHTLFHGLKGIAFCVPLGYREHYLHLQLQQQFPQQLVLSQYILLISPYIALIWLYLCAKAQIPLPSLEFPNGENHSRFRKLNRPNKKRSIWSISRRWICLFTSIIRNGYLSTWDAANPTSSKAQQPTIFVQYFFSTSGVLSLSLSSWSTLLAELLIEPFILFQVLHADTWPVPWDHVQDIHP